MARTSIISMLVLLLMVVPTFGAMADGSFKVILVVPSGTVEDDTTARIEVHSFENGAYIEPSQVQARDYRYNTIPLTQKSKGVWNGTVTAQEGSMITASAQAGSNSSSATVYMRTLQETMTLPKEVVLTPSSDTATTIPKPGDQLLFYIKTYSDGSLEDDYSLQVQYTKDGGNTQTLYYSKMDTGIYKTTFTVPQSTESTSYTITASVTIYGYSRLTSSVEVNVDFAQVWFHKQTLTDTSATFDIDVADMYGKAINGATVYLNYSYQPKTGWTQYKNAGTAVTDSKGKSTYTINYTDVRHDLSLSGTVVISGNVQHIGGDITIAPEPTSAGSGQPRNPTPFTFDVVYQGDQDTGLVPHKSIMVNFRAYYGSFWPYRPSYPLVNATLYYYAYTYKQVVAYGKAVTDTTGNITIGLDVPDIDEETDTLNVDFACVVVAGDMYWHTEELTITKDSLQDYIDHPEKLKDSNVHISVDKLNVGGKTKVSANFPGATSGTQAFQVWVPGEMDIKDLFQWTDTQPEWQQLSGGDRPSMAKSDKTFTGNIYIPEFMPKGTYTIYVGCIVWDKLDYENMYKAMHINYLHVKAGQGAATTGGGILNLGVVAGIDVAILLVLLIVIIVVVTVIVVVVSRRPKRPVAYQQQPAPVPQPVPQPVVVQQPPPQQVMVVVDRQFAPVPHTPQPAPQEHHAVIVPRQEQFSSLEPVPAYQRYDAPPPPPPA